MKYAIVLIFIIVFSGFNQGYYNGSDFLSHIAYNFSHANLIHLLLNSIAYIGVFRLLQKTLPSWWIFALSISVSITASFIIKYPIEVMGASGMVYAMIGMFFAEIINGHLVIADKRLFFMYMGSVVFALAISFFNPHSAFALHVFCLIWAFLQSVVIKKGAI